MFSILQAAGWPIYPLLLCSIATLALIIERFISLRAARIVPANLLEEAKTVSREGLPSTEVVNHLRNHSMLGEVLAAGLTARKVRADEAATRNAMELVGRNAAVRLEKYLLALATIASVAPLLGLLGTVIGMIEIFGAQPNSTGGADPGKLAYGISIALYNTAFGLMIAIPALVFWRYFRSRVDGFLHTLEQQSEQYLSHLMLLK